MTKQELLNSTLTMKTNLILARSLLPLLDGQEYYRVTTKLADVNSMVPALLENLKTHKSQMNDYYFTTQLLNTIREYVEAIKEYCCQSKGSGNNNTFYDDDTITFARYIRNSITHGFTFSFKTKKDIDRVTNNPPKWRGKTIGISLNGKPFDKKFMNEQNVVDLLNDLESVIKNKIK